MRGCNVIYSASGRLWAALPSDGGGLSAPRTHDAPLTARPRSTPVTGPAAAQGTRFPAKLAPTEILPPSLPPATANPQQSAPVLAVHRLVPVEPLNPQYAPGPRPMSDGIGPWTRCCSAREATASPAHDLALQVPAAEHPRPSPGGR